jgi:magnesium chelatase subunit D
MKCYPFAALVGQEKLKQALMVCAVNPSVGGVLIRGDKGTAKSTAARGLVEIMPRIARRLDCPFNCPIDGPLDICEVCRDVPSGASMSVTHLPPPFVTLPLGATEDRVIGSLNFERALKDGKKAFQPGLIASAHRGVLYIDEVNLLPDHLVDVLLDAAAMGINSVEREGLSITHPAKFALIGTMNLEEGELRPQLLDRFGMMVEVEAPSDSQLRAQVVRRRMSFEANPDGFEKEWANHQETLRCEIERAVQVLASVAIADQLLQFISQLCCEFDARTMRADIVMCKVAKTLAALDGRLDVDLKDVALAAELALPHRLRKKPTDQARIDRKKLADLLNQASEEQANEQRGNEQRGNEQQANIAPASKEPGELNRNQLTEDTDVSEESGAGDGSFRLPDSSDGNAKVQSTGREELFQSSDSVNRLDIQMQAYQPSLAQGNRLASYGRRRGRSLNPIACQNPSNLAVNETIRHSVIRNGGVLDVSSVDFHEKVQLGKNAGLILFVVDTSGSMAAQKKMELVKGVVLNLLDDAYQRRDKVGVISFAGKEARLLLAPTRSVDVAHNQLCQLPTGGRTPLAHALLMAFDVINAVTKQDCPEPLLILLSDGKSNVPLSDSSDAWQDSLKAANDLAKSGVSSLVIDTESGYLKFGKASELAGVLNAECLKLDSLSVQSLTVKIGSKLKGAKRRL